MPIFNRWTILPCVSAQTCGFCIWETKNKGRMFPLAPCTAEIWWNFALCYTTAALTLSVLSYHHAQLMLSGSRTSVTKVSEHRFSERKCEFTNLCSNDIAEVDGFSISFVICCVFPNSLTANRNSGKGDFSFWLVLFHFLGSFFFSSGWELVDYYV